MITGKDIRRMRIVSNILSDYEKSKQRKTFKTNQFIIYQ